MSTPVVLPSPVADDPLDKDTRSVPEPSGALAVAGMKKYIHENNLVGKNKRFVATVSGANLNFSRLRFIAERAEVGEGKEAMLRVIIPERPGAYVPPLPVPPRLSLTKAYSFLALHTCIHPRAVTEFVYRYSSPTRAFIFLSFYLSSTLPAPVTTSSATPPSSPASLRATELSTIVSSLQAQGMKALDISDNEMAKSHARYLSGGRSHVAHERMFRFEFPERPGALRKFLEGLAGTFSISLFHYRNQGGGASPFSHLSPGPILMRWRIDVGKVLCGIQVPPSEAGTFQEWLDHLAYPYVDETENQVYRDFLDDNEDAE